MPSNRPNLILDEQAFQDLLSAAFTIQEHNDRMNQVRQTAIKSQVHSEVLSESEADSFCQHCGAPKPSKESGCRNCGEDEFRPGERMQRKWASMWLRSQEQGLWPERTAEAGEASQGIRKGPEKALRPLEAAAQPLVHSTRDSTANNFLAAPAAREMARKTTTTIKTTETKTVRHRSESVDDKAARDHQAAESEWTESPTLADFTEEAPAPERSDLALQTFSLSASDDSSPTDATTEATTADATGGDQPTSLRHRFADLRVTLRFHRADLYLGAAVLLAAVALMWPTVSAPQRAALGPVDRVLVALGIAEAPAPVVHASGDPGIDVWVDPHTALYYCPGAELYGKTADGRVSSQREAQMDRFQPAGRSPCE